MIFYDPIYISIDPASSERLTLASEEQHQVLAAAAATATANQDSSTSPLPSSILQSPPFLSTETTASDQDQISPAASAHESNTTPTPTPAPSTLDSSILHPQQSLILKPSEAPDLSPLDSRALPPPEVLLPPTSKPTLSQDQAPQSLAEKRPNSTSPLARPLESPAPAPELVGLRTSDQIASERPIGEQGLGLSAASPIHHNFISPLPPSPPHSPTSPSTESPAVSSLPSFAMAANIPAKVKAADLTKFLTRAGQLEKVKPVVAYWCEYWVVNQIISKELHKGDSEVEAYTVNLMEKLELVKTNSSDTDAIFDDVAGQAYIEQFALETFQRADRAVQANSVTKQTADTFQAAATFFELINIWNPPDAETQSKIKYAKWNVLRIVKALKEGKDPNESNPKQPEPEQNLPELDPNDPEVLGLGGPPKPRQASVEEVPDEQDRVEQRLARQSSIDQSLHPSAQVSARGSPAPPFDPYPRDGFPYTVVQDDNVSPMEPSPPNGRNGSVGGGYFPEVPTFEAGTPDVPHPTSAAGDGLDLGLPNEPSFNPGTRGPEDFQSFPPPNVQDPPFVPPQDFYTQAPSAPTQPHVHYPPPLQPSQQFQPPQQQYQAPHQHFAPTPALVQQPVRKDQLNTDDVAIAKAQKHARWAISALNFEDAETAVRELREALQTLGA